MTAIPVAFESKSGKYNFLGTSQLINAYAEKMGEDAKSVLAVIPSDGIIQATDEAPGPCRGIISMEDLDCVYHVHPSSVYKLTYDGTAFTSTRIGTIPGIDTVQLSRNQNASPEIVVHSAAGDQVIASDSVSYVLDADLPDNVVTAEYVGGYTVYGIDDRRYFITSLNSSKLIDPLDFATFQQRAGKLIRIVESAGEMVGFCSSWMEFHRKVVDPDFPFAPIGFKSRGLKAANAVVRCDGTLVFPGDDNNIQKLNSYNPEIVGTNEIARLIRDDVNAEDMVGFGWEIDGHAFANFTGSTYSRCYDAATGVWHSRQSYGQDTWRARHSVKMWGKVIVGDAISGKIGRLDSNTFTEYESPMIWGVDSPPMHVFPNGAIVDAVHFDVATGYGTLSGQGSNPKIMLQVSRDGGNTFGGYRELELGVQGKYATRVTARKLGKFGPKGIVFRLRISDPVARSIALADIELRPLKL